MKESVQEAIHDIVVLEVREALAPYMRTLAIIQALAAVAARNEEQTKESIREIATSFTVGDKVQYRQGSGTFPATVKKMGNGWALLTRIEDGKTVRRLFWKIHGLAHKHTFPIGPPSCPGE